MGQHRWSRARREEGSGPLRYRLVKLLTLGTGVVRWGLTDAVVAAKRCRPSSALLVGGPVGLVLATVFLSGVQSRRERRLYDDWLSQRGH